MVIHSRTLDKYFHIPLWAGTQGSCGERLKNHLKPPFFGEVGINFGNWELFVVKYAN